MRTTVERTQLSIKRAELTWEYIKYNDGVYERLGSNVHYIVIGGDVLLIENDDSIVNASTFMWDDKVRFVRSSKKITLSFEN